MKTKPHENPLCRCKPCSRWLSRTLPAHDERRCWDHVVEWGDLGCDDPRCFFCWHRLW